MLPNRHRTMWTKRVPTSFPTGVRVCAIGDSITQYNHGGTSTGATGVYYSVATSNNGEWIQAITDNPSWKFDVWPVSSDVFSVYLGTSGRAWMGANCGIAGITADNMANPSSNGTNWATRATWESLLLYDIIFIALGINDGAEPQFTPAFTRLLDFLARGKAMIVLTSVRAPAVTAVSNKFLATAQSNALYGIASTRKNQCTWLDLSSAYATYGNYGDLSLYRDGLHPSTLGAYGASKVINSFLNNIVQPGNYLLNEFWNNAGATNLAPNPTFTGSGGTAGTGVSGTVPTSWTLAVTGGTAVSTAVSSLVSNSDTGGNYLNIVVTPVIETVAETLVVSCGTVSISSNTWVTGWAEIDLPQGTSAYYSGTITLADNATNAITNTASFDCGTITGTVGTRKVWVKVPPFRTGANATTLTFKINLNIPTSATVNVTTNAAQSYANVATIPVGTAGIGNGMVCSGSGISGSPVVINDIATPNAGSPVSGYVVLSTNQTLGNSLALTFTNPTAAMTWKIRRVWFGASENPQVAVNAAQT